MHAAPFAFVGWMGVPAEQTFFLQSFAVCEATAVPLAVKVKPHTLLTHVRVLHSSSTLAQSFATSHPTH